MTKNMVSVNLKTEHKKGRSCLMVVEAAREIQCYECKASLPRDEVRYLVLWQREREYFPAPFGRNCCLNTVRWRSRPAGMVRSIPVFPRRRAAEVHAEKLNAGRKMLPTQGREPEPLPVVLSQPRKNTWSDLDP